MNGLSHRRSARPGLAPTALQRRWSNVARNRDVKVNPAKRRGCRFGPENSDLGGGDPRPAPPPRRDEGESRGSAEGNGRSAPRPRPLAKSGEGGRAKKSGTADLVLRSGFAGRLRLTRVPIAPPRSRHRPRRHLRQCPTPVAIRNERFPRKRSSFQRRINALKRP
jgi:hypothetical protein